MSLDRDEVFFVVVARGAEQSRSVVFAVVIDDLVVVVRKDGLRLSGKHPVVLGLGCLRGLEKVASLVSMSRARASGSVD